MKRLSQCHVNERTEPGSLGHLKMRAPRTSGGDATMSDRSSNDVLHLISHWLHVKNDQDATSVLGCLQPNDRWAMEKAPRIPDDGIGKPPAALFQEADAGGILRHVEREATVEISTRIDE